MIVNKALQIFLPIFLIIVLSVLIFLVPYGVISSSLIPLVGCNIPYGFVPFDKFIHVVFPALFTFFLARSFDRSKEIATYGQATGMAMVAVFAIGLALELLQIWTPGRTFDYYDLLANGVGICIGGLIRVMMGKLAG